MFDDALDLPIDILHRWRQKAFKPVLAALVQTERRSFVKNGVVQQRDTMQSIVRLGLSDLYHIGSPAFQWVGLQWVGLPTARAIGRTESERTPCAPWMSTPSISAVADGPVWKLA